ncbi:LysR family transcriptional regulator [Acrocarpospora macrocephala]|uniref:LysR family transcriptional regulator n=2 Tax=Acrocarpospora TaxID=90974 RepID=A0A5M3XV80_9ACTN|nr:MULTISPECIES: LysR family transcriptional regulator [Acrocarpospora]GES08879.1 LysR family transcriptional regulator [Acrocarpospora macrocephala]GES23939.1 LysR family transcriptional regulator [Acrocarpospora pleiomorpha]
MLLRQLEYLVALARERHFARAAASCHVSQPSLSAAIRKLERELDVPIVRRGRKFDGLTPEGERVLLWAHRILAEADALRQDLSLMRSSLSGTLRMGAIPTALTAASLLTTPFCERHPHARVSLASLSSREITRRLADFELDVAMTYLDGEPLGNVRTTPLYEERYLLLTPDDAELAGRAFVRWTEVAALPLCLLAPEMRNRRILDGIFEWAGVVAVPAVETDTVSALYAHVATHRWSSVIAHAWLHMFGVPDGMRVIPLENPRQAPRVGLVIADRTPEPVLARALLDVTAHIDIRGTLDRLLHDYLR